MIVEKAIPQTVMPQVLPIHMITDLSQRAVILLL